MCLPRVSVRRSYCSILFSTRARGASRRRGASGCRIAGGPLIRVVLLPVQRVTLGWGDERSTAMSSESSPAVTTMGVDIGKNSFHVIGLDGRGAIVLCQKWSRGQLEARLANLPPCLIGMEATPGWQKSSPRRGRPVPHGVLAKNEMRTMTSCFRGRQRCYRRRQSPSRWGRVSILKTRCMSCGGPVRVP
jgi:hypothetical protein